MFAHATLEYRLLNPSVCVCVGGNSPPSLRVALARPSWGWKQPGSKAFT